MWRAGAAALSSAVLAAAVLQAQTAPGGGERGVTVATYNIHHGSGNEDCTTPPAEPGQPPNPDCNLDLRRIARVIRSLDADIVGLQEVDRLWARSGYVDQPRALARMLRMHFCYGANLDHPADGHANVPHQYGTAILSAWQIQGCENTLLPRTNPANEQRGLLEARINVGRVPLRFYNAHLQHNSLDDRLVQVQAIADRIAAVAPPVVVVGDLNAVPTEVSLPPLLALLTDAWAAGGDGDGFSIPARPDTPPNRRIDYVLVSPETGVRSARVGVDNVAAMASDHYPVVATMAIRK